ncbi:MAG: GNAT family N-acetyltransferase [Zhengella sp.]|uniref:GNAT family N-acetyltransferase n=1 Tax=Zhengella sp. TaxID=2282762 RepID=UPI001E154B4C|nr:GNAT family N-acetyltransferase [Notoacmeibacter sp.]MCC0027220.1 GNAT family N-acetyltransferase [Brucellaceae bacterium]
MTDGTAVTIRPATRADVPAIVALFADDVLGGHGDTADPAALPDYLAAFDRIAASPCDTLFVAELDGRIVGTFQVTLTTAMTGRGRPVLTIEAVQTAAAMRGQGIGAAMVRHAVGEGRKAGARLVQLMSNKTRADAHRFYERLGFARSHEGFKLKL